VVSQKIFTALSPWGLSMEADEAFARKRRRTEQVEEKEQAAMTGEEEIVMSN